MERGIIKWSIVFVAHIIGVGNMAAQEAGMAYAKKTSTGLSIYNSGFPFRWGMLNQAGEKIVPPIYNELKELPNSFFVVEKDTKRGIMNAGGEWVVPLAYDEIEAYQNDLWKVKVGNKYGLYRSQSGVFIPPNYTDIRLLTPTATLILVQDANGKYNVANQRGRLIFYRYYDDYKLIERNQTTYIELYTAGKAVAWCDDKGKSYLFDKRYDGFLSPQNGMMIVHKNNRFGWIDATNFSEKVAPQYDQIMGFSGGIALVRQGNKYAYIRESGEMISPFHLEKALPFTNKVAWAKTKGEWRLYYETGQLVVPATPYRFVEAAANGSWRVSKDSIHWGIIDAKGYMRVPCAYKNIIWQGKDWTIADKGFGERYLFSSRLKKPVYFPFTLEMPLSSDLLLCKTYFDEPILLNTAGKVVIPIAQAITHIAKEKVFIVQQKDKMGVLDEKGMLLIPFEYDRIVFSETKQFIVTKGGLTSYIDRNNQQFNYQSQETPILRPAMPLSADNPPNFSIYEDYDAKGLRVDGVVKQPAIYSMINPNDDCWGGFWVFENGLTGWVQPNGETGIPAEYSYISNFPIDWYCMGYVVAQKNDKYGLISRENKIIIPFEYDEIADNAPNYDLLAVRKGEFWGYYNVQTNSLQQPCVYKKAGVFNGTAIITDQSGRNFVVDAKGNCVAKCTEEE